MLTYYLLTYSLQFSYQMNKLLLPLLLLFPFLLKAQKESFIQSYEVSLNFGVFVLQNDSLPPANSVDFLNYIEKTDMNYIPELYIGLSSRVVFSDQWQTALHLVLWSDFSIQNLCWSSSYQFSPWLGINAGVYTNSTYMTDFSNYHISAYDDFSDISTNVRQRMVKERGFVLGPRFAYAQSRFSTELVLNMGVGFNKPFSEKMILKEKGGNMKKMLIYDTHKEWHVSFAPEWRVSYDVYEGKRTTVGLNGAVRYYCAKQTMNYTQTYAEWTTESLQESTSSLPSHKVSRLYPELGVFWRW